MEFAPKRPKSDVWNYFTLKSSNEGKAICKFCKTEISRGGVKAKSYTTSNMHKHLNSFHRHDMYIMKENENDEEGEREDDVLPIVDLENPAPSTSSETRPRPRPPAQLVPRGLAPVFSSRPGNKHKFTENEGGASTSQDMDAPRPLQMKVTSKLLPASQPTITQVLNKKKVFLPTDSQAVILTKLVGEMICVDCQPLSLVEDVGFNRLLSHLEPRYVMPKRKHFSTVVVPTIYQKVVTQVKLLMADAKYISITTDMWSSTSNTDYLSLTAHFINRQYVQCHIALDVIPFTYESHSGDNIAVFIRETLTEWEILEKLHVIVRDNGRNFEAAMNKGSFESVPCLAHTLQLVVKDGCLNKREYMALTATCRRIVGHFKHSVKASKLLKKAQHSLGLPDHKMVQDEPTRWNSTYNMLERLLEQRKAIAFVTPDLNFPTELSSSDWASIEIVVAILKVFNDATKVVSTASVTISEVIPLISAVKLSLENQREKCKRTAMLAIFNDMLASLTNRYAGYETEQCYSVATLLDPRFKLKIFSSIDAAEEAKIAILLEMEASVKETASKIQQPTHTSATPVDNGALTNPITDLYKQLIGNTTERTVIKQSTIADELADYLEEPLLAGGCTVMDYWKTSRFLHLKEYARKYLATPPATVFSERLFSTSGIICDKRRSRLNPERVRQLVFLNKNLPLVNYKY